jgi:hypothetical protein
VVRVADAGYVANCYWLRFDRGVVRAADAGYVANRYCLRFDRGVVRAADAGYVHEPLLCQTSSNNGWQHSKPQQYESFLCQTTNEMVINISNNNIRNHSSIKSQNEMVRQHYQP